MDYMMISLDKFHELVKDNNNTEICMIIDLRDKREYEEYHVKNAINIEYDNFMEFDNYERVIDKNKTVVLYCDRGGRSIYAAKKLRMYGYQVKSLAGGINNYLNRYKN